MFFLFILFFVEFPFIHSFPNECIVFFFHFTHFSHRYLSIYLFLVHFYSNTSKYNKTKKKPATRKKENIEKSNLNEIPKFVCTIHFERSFHFQIYVSCHICWLFLILEFECSIFHLFVLLVCAYYVY